MWRGQYCPSIDQTRSFESLPDFWFHQSRISRAIALVRLPAVLEIVRQTAYRVRIPIGQLGRSQESSGEDRRRWRVPQRLPSGASTNIQRTSSPCPWKKPRSIDRAPPPLSDGGARGRFDSTVMWTPLAATSNRSPLNIIPMP